MSLLEHWEVITTSSGFAVIYQNLHMLIPDCLKNFTWWRQSYGKTNIPWADTVCVWRGWLLSLESWSLSPVNIAHGIKEVQPHLSGLDFRDFLLIPELQQKWALSLAFLRLSRNRVVETSSSMMLITKWNFVCRGKSIHYAFWNFYYQRTTCTVYYYT